LAEETGEGVFFLLHAAGLQRDDAEAWQPVVICEQQIYPTIILTINPYLHLGAAALNLPLKELRDLKIRWEHG
jgi:hypothetical protein